MSLSENGNGNGMVMPVGPMSGNGMGSFFGGEGSLFYLIILFFFFAMFGGGWGGNYGNPGGSGATIITNDVQNSVLPYFLFFGGSYVTLEHSNSLLLRTI